MTCRQKNRCFYQALPSLLLLLLSLFSAGAAHANDLIAESLQVDIYRGATPAGADLGYLANSDDISATVTMEVSWECVILIFSTCTEAKPDFTARLEVQATNGSFSRTIIIDNNIAFTGAQDVQYRGGKVETNNKVITIPSLQNIPGFNSIMAEARHYGDTLVWRLVVDTANVVPETSSLNNSITVTGPRLWPLSGSLAYGTFPTTGITEVNSVAENPFCDTGSGSGASRVNVLVNANAYWQPEGAGGWSVGRIERTNMCATFALEGEALALTTIINGFFEEKVSVVDNILGDLGGLDVSLTGIEISLVNGITISTVRVTLPDGMSVHDVDTDEGGPVTRGSDRLVMASPTITNDHDLSTIQASDAGRYLHAETLPFSLRYSALDISSAGLSGKYDAMHYAYDRAYIATDPRHFSNQGPVSNDTLFKAPRIPLPSEENFVITATGLQVAVAGFDAPNLSYTHFPYTASIHLDALTVGITDSRLDLNNPAFNASSYTLSSSANCGGCKSGKVSTTGYLLTPLTALYLAGDGSVSMQVDVPLSPKWGPVDNNDANIFQRIGDDKNDGVLYLPGFIASGTGESLDARVTDSLMGSRQLSIFKSTLLPTTHFSLTSLQSRRGNYFMPGLNMGPELYSAGVSKQPVEGLGQTLAGSSTLVGIGGLPSPVYREFSSSPGTKYVLRGGGVTGAFNTDDVTEANIYGYNIGFTDFSFRLVNNKLDPYSWIDGQIAIPGKGRFDVVFESLALECSGDVGGGVIAFTDGPGGASCVNNPAPICNTVFSAWNMSADLISLQFVQDPPIVSACEPQTRVLQIGNTLDVRSLDRKLGMLSKWSSSGNPYDVSITGATDHVLDRPKGAVPASENQGFNVALNSGVALRTPTVNGQVDASISDGWLDLQADISLPFWESLDVDVRIANSASDKTEQEQTVILPVGGNLFGSTTADDAKTNAELGDRMQQATSSNFKASYKWGNTDFGFDLPVYYANGRATGAEANRQKPIFLGRPLSSSLVIMDVNSGINFISPAKTKLSFGASADFSRIPQLGDVASLHIDFNDPDSVEKVDDFLCSFPISCAASLDTRPVGRIFYRLNQQFDLLNSIVGSGLHDFMEQGVRSALSVPAFDSLLDNVSSSLGKVHAIPDRLGSVVSAGVADIADEMTAGLSTELDTFMIEIYFDLPALIIDAQIAGPGNVSVSTVSQLNLLNDKLDDVIDAIDTAKSAATEVASRVTQVKTGITSVLDSVDGSEVAVAINALDSVITELDSVGNLTSCNFNVNDPDAGNKLLGQIVRVHQRISDMQSQLVALNIAPFSSVVADIASIDSEAIRTAGQEVLNTVEDLDVVFAQVKAGIEAICDLPAFSGSNNEMAALVDNAKTLLINVRTQIVLITNAVDAIRQDLITGTDSTMTVLENEIGLTVTKLSAAVSALETLRNTVNSAVGGVTGELDWQALSVAEAQAVLDQIISNELGVSYSWYYAAGLEAEHTMVKAFADSVRNAVDAAIADAVQIAHTNLDNIIDVVPQPGADELRELLLAEIMNSAAVESIDVAINLQLSRVRNPLTGLMTEASDQINYVLKELVLSLENAVNDALEDASASIPDLPMASGRIDGYGLIAGNELERIHLGAEWSMSGGNDEASTRYNAAFDLINVTANSQGAGCGVGKIPGTLSAIISSQQLPITIGGSDTIIRELELGFTLDTTSNYRPVGIFGGISIDGEFKLEAITLYDLAFVSGVGNSEAYIGAAGSAIFDALQFNTAFLLGKTCDGTVLYSLDPEALVGDLNGIFAGAYVRGSASVPIYNNGCALTVNVGADIATWVLVSEPVTYGGLVGGSASGRVACVAALKGKVLVGAEKSGDQFRFFGEGFGVAGLGFDCDPGTWTTVGRSRKDDWCGTGDAQFGAEYNDGWNLSTPKASAIH